MRFRMVGHFGQPRNWDPECFAIGVGHDYLRGQRVIRLPQDSAVAAAFRPLTTSRRLKRLRAETSTVCRCRMDRTNARSASARLATRAGASGPGICDRTDGAMQRIRASSSLIRRPMSLCQYERTGRAYRMTLGVPVRYRFAPRRVARSTGRRPLAIPPLSDLTLHVRYRAIQK